MSAQYLLFNLVDVCPRGRAEGSILGFTLIEVADQVELVLCLDFDAAELLDQAVIGPGLGCKHVFAIPRETARGVDNVPFGLGQAFQLNVPLQQTLGEVK